MSDHAGTLAAVIGPRWHDADAVARRAAVDAYAALLGQGCTPSIASAAIGVAFSAGRNSATHQLRSLMGETVG